MMIDFSKIVELVPDGGRLVLTFTMKTNKTKSGDETAEEISVVFAQQFKGKENDNDFSPIIVAGNIAELNQSFESTVTDIAHDQKRLAALKASTTSRVDQKKKQLSDAIQKHTKASDKSDSKNGEDQRAEKKAELKEEKPKPYMSDLFSMSPAGPAASEKVIPAPGSAPGASESNAVPEVDHE